MSRLLTTVLMVFIYLVKPPVNDRRFLSMLADIESWPEPSSFIHIVSEYSIQLANKKAVRRI